MHFARFAFVALLGLASQAVAQCDDTETAALTCYSGTDGTPQDVVVSDVSYIAAYLRAYGAQTQAGRQFTMTAADAPDCDEWTLFAHGSALALAKHLDTTLNSSVLYSDIANTIDGGAAATADQQAAAIVGCSTDGGSLGVQYNASNPAYNTSDYLAAGYTPDGILIKIVTSGV